jgi:signal transduction histidine kinase
MVQSASTTHRFNRTSQLARALCGIVCLFAVINAGLFVKSMSANVDLVKLTSEVSWRLLSMVLAVVAALIISYQPGNRIGWLLMSPALLIVVTAPIDTYMGKLTSAPPPTILNLLILWFENWSWLLMIFPLLLILLLFPTGKPPSSRWRWVLGYALGKVVYFIFIATFVRRISDVSDRWSLPNPIGFIPDEPWVFTILITPWIVSLGLLSILCALSLFVRYRHAPSTERLQIKWLLFASGVFILLYAVPLLAWPGNSSAVLDLFLSISVLLFPIAIGVAILRYRLYDIDVIINRTLVYGSLTVLVIGFYVLIVGYLGSLLRTENNLLVSLFATGLVAVLFEPLRDRLQRGVNRLMYGRRDEPMAVLSQLGARLEQTLLPDEILPGLVNTVSQTLKLPYVGVALQVGDQLQVQAESGHAVESVESPEAFPLIYQGQTIGQLLVSRRSTSEDLNPADRLLLTNIARQAGVVAHSTRLTSALQQSRQQLVTAREEERRRLRRDLHDGLGPQLASQTLTIDAISKLLERDPTKSKELLDHLKSQSQTRLQDIRRLVYDLRPPALDELGLVGALGEGVKQYGQMADCIEITAVPDPLPVLPAAVEVAVYRIAQEAMTNVVRHAQAQHCTVTMMIRDHHLDLSIADDGKGYPSNFHSGVGLNSMRERAEELGAKIRFENQSRGGAIVKVWLPLPGEEE